MRHQGGRKPFIFGLRSWQPYIQYRRSVQDDHHEQLSHKRMHPLTNPPADRHYLKTVVRFFGVSQSQNHSYLQMNYTHTPWECTNNSRSGDGLSYSYNRKVLCGVCSALESGIPQCLLAFGTLVVHFPDPPLGVAYAAASPIE
jgi:hypothetical protein